ncbi:MAG TPA: phosphatidate cytidylyltransferase [Amaricoccus sp.]|uniref:phosphatidate cytidylyltransferase n=1 Tax=Amaricoccus sp. TaxID=1872485 RepID=UPI001E0B14B9|nr:phosphatidate cytidylyltransferase [Amaricoccus sp.]MCB1371005.1 phosphatidate cytidylyltransferase [Paracoccaceae bacterium]MCC0066414.1 phosphatidate cytidylyltransferase [Rhodovulum sp.]MCB1375363.1 phosphatidate cytidylyltransferase [Paracoccaceae bacterium]MCB1403709.1 phosphatidate cytidylyltransferase [Paracoccaceae bacterium]HPG22853.1 phosphatidate cytidylyltransferase [Amaricoccus sp.]
MTDSRPKPVRFGDLGVRLASGLAILVVALAGVWAGGLWALLLGLVLLLLMLWELHRMVTGDQGFAAPAMLVMAAAAAASAIATHAGLPMLALALLLAGAAVLVPFAGGRAVFLGGGLVYMGGAISALLALRAEAPDGLAVILWLVFVVVAADVGAYFVGRSVGGPRLWKRVSPGKTWSGALGGLLAAGLAGLVCALIAGWPPLRVLSISIGVGIASQCGDLLESALKRHFGIKDSSQLIPGHGGVMDRLDALMGGALFYAVLRFLGIAVSGT